MIKNGFVKNLKFVKAAKEPFIKHFGYDELLHYEQIPIMD